MNQETESRVPRYQVVMDDLMQSIRTGDYSPDEPFCTEAKLMEKYNISRITVRRALDEMENKGLIFRRRGAGCFVSRSAQDILLSADHKEERKQESGQSNKLFAFIFPFDLSRTGLNDAFVAANQYLMENQCYATLYITKDDIESRGRTTLTKLQDMNVSGIAYYPKTGDYHLDFLNKLILQGKSVVVLDVESHCPYISSVTFDNLKGSLMLMEHLTQLGHRRIGYLSGVSPASRSSICDRFAGYLLGHEKAGLSLNPEYIAMDLPDNISSPRESAQAMRDELRRFAKRGVTAVLAENDAVAYKIILACREIGLRVPEDMSVCGFDNNEFAHILENSEQPLSITTVGKDQSAAGREAARLLLENAGKPIHPSENIVLPVKLVRGTSTTVPGRFAQE